MATSDSGIRHEGTFSKQGSKLASLGFDKWTVAGGWRVNLLERSVKETGAPPNQGRARTG